MHDASKESQSSIEIFNYTTKEKHLFTYKPPRKIKVYSVRPKPSRRVLTSAKSIKLMEEKERKKQEKINEKEKRRHLREEIRKKEQEIKIKA